MSRLFARATALLAAIALLFAAPAQAAIYRAAGTPQSTFAALPSPSAVAPGIVYLVTDVGPAGSLWLSTGSAWTPAAPITLCSQGAANSFTTATTQTQLTCTIPANALTGHRLSIDCLWSNTANATAKTFRAKLGSATIFARSSTSTTVSYRGSAFIVSRSSSSQVAAPQALDGGGGVTSGTVVTASVDTTGSQAATCEATNPSAGDTITLEAGEVRLLP